MKKLTTLLFGALAFGAALPAIAGPDWAAIEHARNMPYRGSELMHPDVILVALATTAEAAEARTPAPTAVAPQASAATAVMLQKCAMPERLVLPLDHGPRADTTPYMNRLRKERYDAEVHACKESLK